MSAPIDPTELIDPIAPVDTGDSGDSGVESRVREALRLGHDERVPGRSRGVSYAPQDLEARLRRVAALRRLCLDLRRAGAQREGERLDEGSGDRRPPPREPVTRLWNPDKENGPCD